MIFNKGDLTTGRYSAQITDCLETKAVTERYLAQIKGIGLNIMIKGECMISNGELQGKCDDKKWRIDFIRREYDILRSLRHMGIPRVIEYVCEKERAYMLMPYYRGVSLEAILLQGGEMEERKVLDIAKKLCAVLSYLQDRERVILHNDIKPSNILLKEDGEVILLDFGLSSYEGEKRADVLFQGTLGYAAPECWHQGMCALSKATDIFAFGATLYRMLEGKQPKAHYGRFLLSDCGRQGRWQTMINKCCTLEAKHRYQDAAQVFEELQHIRLK